MSKVINAGNNYLNKFQVINVVFKERKDDFILEKLLVLALFGSILIYGIRTIAQVGKFSQ